MPSMSLHSKQSGPRSLDRTIPTVSYRTGNKHWALLLSGYMAEYPHSGIDLCTEPYSSFDSGLVGGTGRGMGARLAY